MASYDATRPNIVFILTDDQGAWALGCAGNEEIQTPSLDRLAQTGTRFENYFCTCPVCSPARATLLTGCIPSRHGVHDYIRIRQGQNPLLGSGNGRAIEYLAGQTAYTDVLSAEGYTCGLSGKWHLGDECRPQKNFSFWRVNALGNGPYYRTPLVNERGREAEWVTRYFTEVVTDNALTFLEQQKGAGSPFYLSCHYTAPHAPWQRQHHPHETYDRYYKNCPFESVPEVPLNPAQTQRPWLKPDGSNRREPARYTGARMSELVTFPAAEQIVPVESRLLRLLGRHHGGKRKGLHVCRPREQTRRRIEDFSHQLGGYAAHIVISAMMEKAAARAVGPGQEGGRRFDQAAVVIPGIDVAPQVHHGFAPKVGEILALVLGRGFEEAQGCFDGLATGAGGIAEQRAPPPALPPSRPNVYRYLRRGLSSLHRSSAPRPGYPQS